MKDWAEVYLPRYYTFLPFYEKSVSAKFESVSQKNRVQRVQVMCTYLRMTRTLRFPFFIPSKLWKRKKEASFNRGSAMLLYIGH
jgi:hypothetical protein